MSNMVKVILTRNIGTVDDNYVQITCTLLNMYNIDTVDILLSSIFNHAVYLNK